MKFVNNGYFLIDIPFSLEYNAFKIYATASLDPEFPIFHSYGL